MVPAQHVGFVDGSEEVVSANAKNKIGIVDPYIERQRVNPGDKFYLCLYPGTVTGLRHQYSHPAFKDSGSDKDAAEKWLMDFASKYYIDYDALVDGASSGAGGCFGDDDGPSAFSNSYEFWDHLEALTGKTFSETHRDNTYFRCAC